MREDAWIGRGFVVDNELLRVTRVMARWFELEGGSKWCVDDWGSWPKKDRRGRQTMINTYAWWLANAVDRKLHKINLWSLKEDELVQLNELLDRAIARLEGGGK